ncbi:phosphoglucosamine mutase [Congregibacter litoralis]|uniref:Phosphoglucosamine mutase n=1 Tax=Congregibacter litoralis KT71 TaxID=314285 RepID=A4A9Y5_9GAMM|nr:phosphoglucosamine mutase [Congregibacter litoralis]EAQ97302.1 phosphoglucosamine mutase [Congregibacter litoralis KT71]
MKKRYFGTDGIRGLVGEAPITPDFVLKLGWACGRVFTRQMAAQGRCSVIIGKDTRVSGYMFESALEAGLVAAGVDVKLLGPMPTPAVALMTRTQNADAGIVISASHNAYFDNGIKFFSATGSKLPDEIELAIEAELELPLACVESHDIGKVQRVVDAAGRYIEFCKSTVPEGFSLRGLRIAMDCAHGATYHIAPSVLSELGAEVISIGVSPDGFNINEGVGSTHMDTLAATVRERNCDLGIAYDGDGDRVLFVDDQGATVDGDQLLYVIAMHRLQEGSSDTGVVGTLMSNLGLELALREQGLQFVRAQVGDRYVREMMETQGWHLGGESSGHIICSDVTTTGDGIVSSLQVLRALQSGGRSLREVLSDVPLLPQTMINVRISPGASIASQPEVLEAVAQVEAELGDNGRVLLRPSGTEPVIRVMIEGRDAAQVDRLCRSLAQTVEGLLAAA